MHIQKTYYNTNIFKLRFQKSEKIHKNFTICIDKYGKID